MNRVNSRIFKIFIGTLWLILYSVVLLEYKEIKLKSTPFTVLNFDIAVLEKSAPIERAVFYYDTGLGFNGNELVVCDYSPDQRKGFKHYSVKLRTHKRISRLRFDPLDGDGIVTLKNLAIKQYIEKKVDFSQFNSKKSIPVNIENVRTTKNSITIVAKGRDAHLVLVNNFSLYQK